MATCKCGIECGVVAAPVAAATLAAMQGGGDHQFGYFEHVSGFVPRGRRNGCIRHGSMGCQQARRERIDARPRLQQALFIAAQRDVLPHHLAQFAARCCYTFAVGRDAQQRCVALQVVVYGDRYGAARGQRIVCQFSGQAVGQSQTEDQAFQERVAGESIRAMHACAGHFANGIQTRQRGLPPRANHDAAHEIVRGGSNG